MEIRNRSEQTIGLYENHGLRFIGKTATYYSNLFNEEHDIITHIAIINTTTNETVYSRVLENNFIYLNTFTKSCEEILFYFSHNTLDSYSINKTIQDVLISNNGNLFVHRQQQLIKKEEEELVIMQDVEKCTNEYNQVVSVCEEKNYTLFQGVHCFYVLSFQNKEDIKRFNNLNKDSKQYCINNSDKLNITVIAKQQTNIGCHNSIWYYDNMDELYKQIA
jgi:hypothetical protein